MAIRNDSFIHLVCVAVRVLVDSLGVESLIFSGPITSTVDSDVISDAVRGVGSIAFIEDWPDFKRTRDATTMNVGGRYVTVGRPRSKAQSTITVSVDTNADRDALDQVLNGLTEGVLLIRKQVTNSRVDGYMALIRPRFAGFCGSDRGIWFRRAFKEMIYESLDQDHREVRVIGHELFGEVLAIGSHAARELGLKVGDTVSTESHIICGTCYQCRIGDTHVCEDNKIIGISTGEM